MRVKIHWNIVSLKIGALFRKTHRKDETHGQVRYIGLG